MNRIAAYRPFGGALRPPKNGDSHIGACPRVSGDPEMNKSRVLKACAALALALGFFGRELSSALLQVLMPFSFVPVKGAVRILSVRPGDAAST